ncbi:hypothetical protein EIP86_002943 [Pleurotus ostreatoroseus]|nr:hypothetical protein EIP86_002943 [Pleurotus ostreatoroseus]
MNGHQPQPGADEEQLTERTALLGRHSARAGRGDRREEADEGGYPPVEPVVARLQEGIAADCAWCPEEVPEADKPAYIVVALLQLRQTLAQQAGPQEDTWEQWLGEQTRTSVMENAEKQIAHTWMQFLSAAHTSEEVQEFLWSTFPLREDGIVTVRGESLSPSYTWLILSYHLHLGQLLTSWDYRVVQKS